MFLAIDNFYRQICFVSITAGSSGECQYECRPFGCRCALQGDAASRRYRQDFKEGIADNPCGTQEEVEQARAKNAYNHIDWKAIAAFCDGIGDPCHNKACKYGQNPVFRSHDRTLLRESL